jgi:hypothetical protein
MLLDHLDVREYVYLPSIIANQWLGNMFKRQWAHKHYQNNHCDNKGKAVS